MPIKLANNASGTLATAIYPSDTGLVLTTGDGAEFPTLGAGDYFYATITSSQGTQEIVQVTARVGDTMTVVRAQEGTTAAGFAVGARFELRVTAQSVLDVVGDVIASQVGFTPTGTVAATDVQAAIAEVDSEKVGFTRLDDSDGSSLVGYLPAGTGAVATTVQSKLRETPSPRDFGVVADGTTDDTAAWQLWINYCASAKAAFVCQERLTSKITSKLVFPLVLVTINSVSRALPIDLREVDFLYSGSRTDIAIDIGEAPSATGYYLETDIWLPRLTAAGSLQWPGTIGATDIGVRIRQAFRCRIHENFIYGFTNGIVYSGCAYNTIIAKHISDSKFGLIYTTAGADQNASFTNQNVRIGGKIGNTSAASALGDAFLIVFTWDKVSSYRGHNANTFIAPCLESNGSSTYQLPIWFDGVGGINSFEHVRLEGCKGPVGIFDGGGGTRACGTTINLDYIAYSGQQISLRQVNGACGNILTGVGCASDSWNSGDLTKAITSAGAAGTAWLRGSELFFVNAGTPTTSDFKRIETTFTTALRMNRLGVQLASGGAFRIGVAVDTTRIKDFECSFESLDSFIGRPCFLALDSQGTLLTGNATETFANPLTGVTYSNELYVKATPATGDVGQTLASSGSTFVPSSDASINRIVRVTVRPEVAVLVFSVVAASTIALVKSLSIKSFASTNKIGEAYPLTGGRSDLHVFSLVDDDGAERIATAKPDTAGTFGYYGRGAVVYNRSAASGVTAGWQCNAAGWLCPVWVASTSYAVLGMLVTNDLGKVYELTTAGTSASSGGPTGTTATWDGITDGTCKWRYIGTLATFTALPNNP